MNNPLQDVLEQHRSFNFIFMWMAIAASYIMFFVGIPYYIWAIAIALVNMSAVLIFSAFIEEEVEKKPTHSPEVKWDPKKKYEKKDEDSKP